MNRYYFYFTLLFVTFLTLFSFFHMSTIVDVSHDVITIVFKNLLPSLLPFMILVSLCLNLGILDILAYFLQIPFYNLFSLTPMMSSLYFVSFFCGYPTNVKIIKEAYELKRFDQVNDDFKDSVFDVDKVIGSYWASSDFLCYTQIFIVLIAGIFLLIIMP